jgi:hypothetical protein
MIMAAVATTVGHVAKKALQVVRLPLLALNRRCRCELRNRCVGNLDVDHGERRLAWLCLVRLGHFVSEQPQQYLIARLIAGRISFGSGDQFAVPDDVFIDDEIAHGALHGVSHHGAGGGIMSGSRHNARRWWSEHAIYDVKRACRKGGTRPGSGLSPGLWQKSQRLQDVPLEKARRRGP